MATLTKGKTFTNGELVTPAGIHQLVDAATISGIVNADIAAGAAIVDTKLAQITTAGKVLPAAVQGTAVITTDSRLSDARTPTSHTHTIANVTNLQTSLDGKQASGSYAPATGIAATAITGTAVITTDSRLSDARTPTSHTHDDRYYTESEIDTKLSGLPVSGHNHDASAINAGTLANARTTATNANTANAIVARDASGNFSAGTITAALSGNASTASKLATARTITLGGDLSGSVSFDGSANATLTAAVADDSHNHTIANIDNLQTALDGKQAAGSYAPASGISPSAITGTAVITTDSRLVPAGAIMPFAMSTAPSGWLAADGAEVSRSTYLALFSAIGTTHGAGNGSTTFNLPDLSGIFVRGTGSQTYGGNTYAGTLGTKSVDTFKLHSHPVSGTTANNVLTNPSFAGTSTGSATRVSDVNQNSTTISGTAAPTGSIETAPANIALLYCIKF
jgi:microcystin-dependent protein